MTAIRIGLPKSSGSFVEDARRLGAPVLISANSHWVPPARLKRPSPRGRGRSGRLRPGYFRPVCERLRGLDAALDSGGFVAMARYGRFRFSIREYVAFAASFPWTWWAQQDFCVEEEIAPDRATVRERIYHSAVSFDHTLDEVARQRDQGATLTRPVPVLQGRRLEDYLLSAELVSRLTGGLPPLVGVGSVCGRTDEEEILALLRGLCEQLPEGVHFHLFGVKGAVLGGLDETTRARVASTDSMAWNLAGRHSTTPGASSTNAHRGRHMRRWYVQQRKAVGAAPAPDLHALFAGPLAARRET